MKAHRIPVLVRPVSAALLSLFLLFATAAGPASAEDPLSADNLVTDRSGVLGADKPRVQAALKQFTRKTGVQLYVVYVKDFGGLSGSEWAARTASKSTIGTTDILVAISTDDRTYGVAEPTELGPSRHEFNAVSVDEIRPAVNTGQWADAAIDAAAGYERAYRDSGLPWTPIVIGIAVVLAAGVGLIFHLRRNYDQTHEIRDEHGKTIDPLELLRTRELIDHAQLAVAAVEDPVLKVKLAKKLEILLAGKDSRDARRALAISIIHRSTQFEHLTTAGRSGGAHPS